MPFTDLLRVTVLLIAAAATALAAVALLAAARQEQTSALILAAVWWPLAIAAGLVLGRGSQAGERLAGLLASARTATALPEVRPGRMLVNRLWPLGVFAAGAGAMAWAWPQVPAIAAGYALLWSLAWRSREAAVTGIEDRDGVRFFVEPSGAFEPIRLVRTPGLSRELPQEEQGLRVEPIPPSP